MFYGIRHQKNYISQYDPLIFHQTGACFFMKPMTFFMKPITSAWRTLVLTIFIMGFAPPAPADDSLVIATTAGAPLINGDRTGFMERVAIEVFRRIGKSVEIVSLPAERSLLNVNDGVEDAEFVRISGLRKNYPNLRQVPEPIYVMEFSAFSNSVQFSPTDWNSLKPYDVAFVTGWKILEANIKGSHTLTKLGSPENLFTFLDKRRTQVAVFAKWQGIDRITKLGLKDITIMEPPLATRNMYLYLNKKHEGLVPKISEALKQMKRDGTYDAIKAETLLKKYPDHILGGTPVFAQKNIK